MVGLLLIATLSFLTIEASKYISARKTGHESPQPVILWSFEQAERGAIISTPVVSPDSVYVSAIRDNALAPSGVVYCLDRRSGHVRWHYDDGGAMLHTISSPWLQDGRLYVGEGMHGNDVCKLRCLDAASGKNLWQFITGGHIESSPCVADGVVVFGSGDDGIYGVNAASGKKCWQKVGRWHVDASPAVRADRVYAGGGVSERYRRAEIFCLKLSDGEILWRTATELPVWGSPLVDGEQVFFGSGTGRLTQSAEEPEKAAGALLCVDAATGKILWTYPVEDAIFGRSAADERHVYFGARDGRCYCLDRRERRQLWQVDLGQPIVTQPALVDGRLYVVASGGRIACLQAESGQTIWTFDLAAFTQTRPQLLSSPIVQVEEDEGGRHYLLFLGTELRTDVRSSAMLYCLRDEISLGGRP
jgi:outer membrane protein assembly factor BamB